MSDSIAYLLVAAKLLAAAVGFLFLVSGIDDLFIDVCYLAHSLARRLRISGREAPPREEDLRAKPEQWVAVMIPAWQESAVIAPMLMNARRTLDYTHYVIFVGTYPNDQATAREVDRLEHKGAEIVRVTVPHDGPTNKADCLNWIYHGIRRYETAHSIEFQIHVMQDCEDVIHPLCYRLFNYLIPKNDMVQLPVLSLDRRWFEFTGGHYLDEFAQLHYKDLVVRQLLNHSLPAAGVGVAFSRRAFASVASAKRNQLFSTSSLTEDYDFGFRLKQLGLRQTFCRFEVQRRIVRQDERSGRERITHKRELVGVREFFPSNVRSAVKQKSRWVIGIAMQGWAHLGWTGDLCTNYMLYRDRKSIIMNLVTICGYAVVLVVVSIWGMELIVPDAYRFPPIVERGSALWYLLIVNFVLLVSRLGQRMYCVARLHNLKQALLSAPRMAWSNVINFAATVRAIRIYLRYLRTGKAIAWDKTDHSYPAAEEIPFGQTG